MVKMSLAFVMLLMLALFLLINLSDLYMSQLAHVLLLHLNPQIVTLKCFLAISIGHDLTFLIINISEELFVLLDEAVLFALHKLSFLIYCSYFSFINLINSEVSPPVLLIVFVWTFIVVYSTFFMPPLFSFFQDSIEIPGLKHTHWRILDFFHVRISVTVFSFVTV